MTEQEFRERIGRYERLLKVTSDKLVRDVLIRLIAEAEQRLEELLKKLGCRFVPRVAARAPALKVALGRASASC